MRHNYIFFVIPDAVQHNIKKLKRLHKKELTSRPVVQSFHD